MSRKIRRSYGKENRKKIKDAVGENLDRLITIDWRGQGHIHPLYESLREQSQGPLTMGAAQITQPSDVDRRNKKLKNVGNPNQ